MYKSTLILLFLFHAIVIISAAPVGTNCTSYQVQNITYDYFNSDNFVGARPTGYKELFHLAIVLNKSALIVLASADYQTSSLKYDIELSARNSDIRLVRATIPIEKFYYAVPEVADVVISITNDNILAVTLNGETIITYKETNPFPIKYFGFATQHSSDNARFFYKCKWLRPDVSASTGAAIRHLIAEQETDRRLLAGFGRTDCTSYRSQRTLQDFFESNRFVRPRSTDEKENFHFSVIVNKSALIVLTSADFKHGITIELNARNNDIRLLRSGTPVEKIHYNIPEVADVVISITIDDILAVTLNEKTIITYKETNPFPIRFFGLATKFSGDKTRFFYKCQSQQANDVSASTAAAIEHFIAEQETERRVLAGLMRRECTSYRSKKTVLDFFDSDGFVEARWTGYKMQLHLSVILNKTAVINLYSTNSKTNPAVPYYDIHLDIDSIKIFNREMQLAFVTYSTPASANVVIAITYENILTVTINGDTQLSFKENNPFPIEWIGFRAGRSGDTARFFYNCKLKRINDGQCGKRKVLNQPLITRGSRTREGDWPWHAAIFHMEDEMRKYRCGGTLITSDAVVTAAHCLHDLGRVIVPYRVIVSLGKHDLQLAGPNTLDVRAYRLIIHSGYDRETFQNDIGIIRLSLEATFTTRIQPICLWPANRLPLEEVIGRNGIVVGWGLNEKDQLPDELDLAYMPVVSSVTCLESDPDFFNSFIHRGSFCAGFRNGTGACNGDSGGGMFFEENGSYTLRGIVSQTKARGIAQNSCDPKHYVVFTDAAYYSTWILEKIKSDFLLDISTSQ